MKPNKIILNQASAESGCLLSSIDAHNNKTIPAGSNLMAPTNNGLVCGARSYKRFITITCGIIHLIFVSDKLFNGLYFEFELLS